MSAHRRAEAVILQFETYQHLLEGQDSGSLMEHVLARRQLIRRIAKLNNTAEAAVFGSAVRGDETLESDIDLLIEPMGGATHFDLAQFQIDMEQLFQRPIDLLSRGALDPSKDGKILDEAVPV